MDSVSIVMTVATVSIMIVFAAVAAAVGSKKTARVRERAREAGRALGLEYIEGIEAFRTYHVDTGQSETLAWIEKLPAPIRRFISSGSWWRLQGERNGARVYAGVEGRGKNNSPYTVLRAFYVRELGFALRIEREGVLTKVGKTLFQIQDVELGDPGFDPIVRVKASEPLAAMTLLSSSETRSAIVSAIQGYPAMVADSGKVSWEKAGIHLDPGELGPALDALAAVAVALGGGALEESRDPPIELAP